MSDPLVNIKNKCAQYQNGPVQAPEAHAAFAFIIREAEQAIRRYNMMHERACDAEYKAEAMEAEVERLRAANEDALQRLQSSADIASRNLMMRALLKTAKRYRRTRLHDDSIEYSYAEAELDRVIAACEEK